MNNDHEAILDALFIHLSAVAATAGFQTISRRTAFWMDVAAQPALFLRHTAADDAFNDTMLSATTLEAEIWIYSRAGEDPSVAPDVELNRLVKIIRDSFAPDDGMQFRFTLGGRVHWCRIEGRSDYDPGDIDKQSKAVLPVRITLP